MRITVKNYRGFGDANPLILDLRPGFTGFVGPNNAGKSTCLRFFYETRALFQALCELSSLPSWLNGNPVGISFHGVEDQTEVVHKGNGRDLSIEFAFDVTRKPQLARLVLRCARHTPSEWRLEAQATDGVGSVNGLMSYEGINVAAASGVPLPLPADDYALLKAVAHQALYIGPFRNAITEGSGAYLDLSIGTTFVQQWHDWKTGDTRANNEAALALTRELAHIFDMESLERNATTARSLQVIVNGNSFRLREIGAGFTQFLVVLANVAIRRPRLLLLDEPELNLHPRLQADFLTTLASYCDLGMLFATHSIGLARANADRLYSCRRDGDACLVRDFHATQSFAAFAGEMGLSSYRELGHETLLLVEGVTEVKALQQLLRMYRKDHTVIVLPLGGRQMIRSGVTSELAELHRLAANVAVLVDSERKTQGEPIEPGRRAFAEECAQLGFRVHVLERRALENYFSQAAITAALGEGHSALSAFDALGERSHGGWAKRDNWRICREMTNEEVAPTDLGEFLAAL